MNLRDKHLLVTGGSAGIGLALTRALLDAGARVTICGRRQAALDAACEALGEGARAVRADLTDAGDRAALAREVTAVGLDGLINNAASQQLMDFTAPAQERAVAREIALNLTAPVLLTDALLPHLMARPQAAVVNITSGLALTPKRSAPVYCATKAGLRSFTKALRWQLDGTGVRVMEVLPPVVDTEMTAGRGANKLTPEQVAGAIVAGLRADRDEVRVGKVKLLFAVQRLSPALAERILRDA